ncbi:MAG: tryptophan synthase subunit alpha [Gemmatimonadetes bacterium]|nr:tryptophan synthase subunit alpha [Gemmatimonadota bacterium]
MVESTRPGRLAPRFAAWGAAGRRALIPYLTAGYPDPAATGELLVRLADAGADILELGVPFSDPLADGPTIQRASQRALERGVTLGWTLDQLAAFRAVRATAVVLFTYLNPLLSYGVSRLVRDSVAAGADGLLVTDLPLGADPVLERGIEDSELDLVRLVAPTTPAARARDIARRAQGFLYYISRTGVTGASARLRQGLTQELLALREVARVPIAVGFGISSPEQAAEVAAVADGVVVGSALIDALDSRGPAGAEKFLRSLRRAMDEAPA